MSDLCDKSEPEGLQGARVDKRDGRGVDIRVTRADAPTEGSRPDLYITTTSTVVPDWPSVRGQLLSEQPDLFDGYNERPADWLTDQDAPLGVFIDTWLVTARGSA